jgi:hypothetical protein
MPPTLARIVVFLLIPCLLTDPTLGSIGALQGVTNHPFHPAVSTNFNAQALAPVAGSFANIRLGFDASKRFFHLTRPPRDEVRPSARDKGQSPSTFISAFALIMVAIAVVVAPQYTISKLMAAFTWVIGIFKSYSILDTGGSLAVLGLGLRAIYQYTDRVGFKRYAGPALLAIKPEMRSALESIFRALGFIKMVYGPLFFAVALKIVLTQPYPGCLLVCSAVLIVFHTLVVGLGVRGIFPFFIDQRRLLRITPEQIDLLGPKPSEYNAKAIGYRWRIWPWSSREDEFVLWLKEPRVLLWMGRAGIIPVYITPTEFWTPAWHKIRNRLPAFLRVAVPARVPGRHPGARFWSA